MRAGLAVLFLCGCGTYDFNRAALVPRATPRLDDGQPLAGRGQVTGGVSSAAHLGDPGDGDPRAGIEIPGTQLEGGLKLRIGDHVAIGGLYETGLASGARRLRASQPRVEGGNVNGVGFTIDVSIPTGDPRIFVGIGADAMVWSVPYVEYLTCAEGETCFPFQIEDHGRDSVTTGAVSITPSVRASELVTVFGGMTLRQHPVLLQRGQERDPLFTSPEVSSGPANVIVSGGVTVGRPTSDLQVRAVAYYDVTQSPAKYKPGLALVLVLPFGDAPQASPPTRTIYVPVAPR